MKILYWFLKIILYLPIRIFFPTHITGRKNLGKGKVILVCNHQSNLDPLIISLLIPKQPYFLAKQELFKNKFLSSFFKQIGSIPVDRKNVGISTIKEALSVLKQEKRLVIFPEGTRKKISLEDSENLKNGAGMFALKAQCNVVPMYFTKKPGFLRFTKLIIGKPINLEEYFDLKTTKENISIVGEKIKNSMIDLKKSTQRKKNYDPLRIQNE